METTNIIVTSNLYGGEAGLRSILNDYYENEIEELTPEERPVAKKFIEEGLIVGGKRVGVTEGVEKEHYQVNEVLLDKLLESRLIRIENTHLGKSFEVSHDAMVAPIAASYEKRRIIEEKAAKDAELRRIRKQFLTAASIALVGFILAAVAGLFYLQAQKAQGEAEKQKIEAENLLAQLTIKQRENVIERCQRYVNSGKTYMADREFDKAINEFNKAIQAIRDYQEDLVAKDNAEAIETCIAEAEALIETSRNNSGLKGAFDQSIAEGESRARRKDFLGARTVYRQALKTGYDDRTARNKINENEVALKAEFNTLIEKANTLFSTAKSTNNKRAYRDARDYYEKAKARFPLADQEQRNLNVCLKNL